MDALAGCMDYGLAGLAGRVNRAVADMLIFRRAMLVAMMTREAPPEKAESIVLGSLAAIGYTAPTPMPTGDVVSLTLYIRSHAERL